MNWCVECAADILVLNWHKSITKKNDFYIFVPSDLTLTFDL